MNRKPLKLIFLMVMMMVVSCDEPVTVVTNFVHNDGTITRKIEMRNSKNNFSRADLQVPFDSTWIIVDSMAIDDKNDTTWIRTATKLFKNADEINQTYKLDSGANRNIARSVKFEKRFRWFNTEFRFHEKIDKKLSFGYPAGDFLNSEELKYFYAPDNFKFEKEGGADSVKYIALSDSIKVKTDRWAMKNFASEWIGEFSKLTVGKTGDELSFKSLKMHEDEYVKILENSEDKFDSLWSNGIILNRLIGEDAALKFRTEADSSVEMVTDNFFVSFKQYTVRISLPGKLTGTNGFIDSSQVLLWPVKSDFFLTEPYVMWAESKVPNIWAWIVSVVFLSFVIAGMVFRVIKKG